MITGAVLLAPSPLVMTDLLDRTDTAAPPALDKETDRAPVGRLASLDALRGLTILGMIVVNTQGDGDHAFWGTQHARWNGWTPADLVFPSFLFIVGTSMAYAFARHTEAGRRPAALYGRIARRTLLLFLLGLVVSGLGRVPLADLHVMGVLQRIALCYLLASLAVLHLRPRTQLAVCAAILVGYWLTLTRVPVPGHGAGVLTPHGNLTGYIDRRVLGRSHLYADGPYDPEGLLSTLPATVTVVIGYWAGRFLRRAPVSSATSRRLAWSGVGFVVAGELSQLLLPINKRIWTSSFVLLAAGFSLLLLAAAFELVDVRGRGRLGWPFAVFGLNAIVVYMASELASGWLTSSGWRTTIWHHGFAPWLGPEVGSLAYALAFAGLWWLVLLVMYRRRMFIRL